MTFQLTLYSDFVCPYCYIAERAVIRRVEARYDVAVDWRGFELHPEIPRGGVEIERLFPGPMLQRMGEQLLSFAELRGVELSLPSRVPNTRAALALTEYARDHGVLAEVRDAAMDAFWLRGEDLEDPSVLGALAAAAGLDAAEAVAFAFSEAGDEVVLARREEASDRGVTAIPTTFIGRIPLLGCQPLEAFERALERAGAVACPPPAANGAPAGLHLEA